MLGRRCCAAGDPVEERGVILFQQRLVAVELGVAHAGEVLLGERAQQQVGLLGAAMPAAEQQALAADIQRFAHGGGIGNFRRGVSLPRTMGWLAVLCIVAAGRMAVRASFETRRFAPLLRMRKIGDGIE